EPDPDPFHVDLRRGPGRGGRSGAAARDRDLDRLGPDPRAVQPAVLGSPARSALVSDASTWLRRVGRPILDAVARQALAGVALAKVPLAGLALGLLASGPAAAQAITVSAAASLTNAFKEI